MIGVPQKLPDMSLDFFPQFIGDYIAESLALQKYKNPIGCAAIPALAALATAAGNMACLKVRKKGVNDSFSVRPNLYSLLVSDSGGGKSPLISIYTKPISKIEKEKRKLHLAELKRRQTQIKEKNKDRINNKKPPLTQDEEAEILNYPYPAGVPQTDMPLFCNDVTIEGAQAMAADQTNGNIGMVRDEFSALLNSFQRVGRENDRSFVIEAYECNSNPYRIIRKMKEAKTNPIYDLCMNLLGGIQHKKLTHVFNKYEKSNEGDGLFSRFQNAFYWEQKRIRDTATYNFPADSKIEFEKRLLLFIEERIRRSKIGLTAEHDEFGIPTGEGIDEEPHSYELSLEAQERWIAYSDEIDKAVFDSDLMKECRDKHATYTLKIALLLSLATAFNPFCHGNIVDLKTMENAISISRVVLEHSKFVCGELQDEDAAMIKRADALLAKIKEKDRFASFPFTLFELTRTEWKALPRLHTENIHIPLLQETLDFLVAKRHLFESKSKGRNHKPVTTYSLFPSKNYTPPKEDFSFEGCSDELEKEIQSTQEESLDNVNIYEDNPYESCTQHQAPLKKHKVDTIDLEKIKADHPLEEVMRSKGIIFKKNKALCPFHDEKNPSLSIYKNHYKCFGCGKGGDVFDFLREYEVLGLLDAVKYLSGHQMPILTSNQEKERAAKKAFDRQAEDQERVLFLHNLTEKFKGCKETQNPETIRDYLKKRLGDIDLWDPLIKDNPDFQYHDDIDGRHTFNPAMVVAIRKGDELIGLQKTFLTEDKLSNKKDPKKPTKNYRRFEGETKGGHITLRKSQSPTADRLIITEGTEKGFGFIAKEALHGDLFLPKEWHGSAVWSAVTSGNLSTIALPDSVTKVLIAGDSDETGRREAYKAKEVFEARGIQTTLHFPSIEGKDWDDDLFDDLIDPQDGNGFDHSFISHEGAHLAGAQVAP